MFKHGDSLIEFTSNGSFNNVAKENVLFFVMFMCFYPSRDQIPNGTYQYKRIFYVSRFKLLSTMLPSAYTIDENRIVRKKKKNCHMKAAIT